MLVAFHVVFTEALGERFTSRTTVPAAYVRMAGRTITRFIVLEDVEGETVTIYLGSPSTEFDEFAPERQKVLDSVKWTGS